MVDDMNDRDLDLCVVAGRRPELLRATLESFSELVFRNFRIANVFINLDPIFGDADDEARCVRSIESHFPAAVILRPETPGFAPAVKRLWSNTKSGFVFHLEDDWMALQEIGQEALEPFADSEVAQVSFHHADKNWDIAKKGHLHQRNEYARFLGMKIPLFKTFPKFTTSPSILRGDFARKAAALMDTNLDPEKQFYAGVNVELERFVSSRKNYIFSPDQTPVIRDTGRQWRDERKIEKVTRNTTSYWVTK